MASHKVWRVVSRYNKAAPVDEIGEQKDAAVGVAKAAAKPPQATERGKICEELFPESDRSPYELVGTLHSNMRFEATWVVPCSVQEQVQD